MEESLPMSLLDDLKQEFQLLTKTRVSDGQFGSKVVWVPGITFYGTLEYMGAPEMVVAQQQGVSRVYRIYVDKALDLDCHEVFKRVEDEQVFRVTNPGPERNTPPSSMLNKRLIEIEKWELPHDED